MTKFLATILFSIVCLSSAVHASDNLKEDLQPGSFTLTHTAQLIESLKNTAKDLETKMTEDFKKCFGQNASDDTRYILPDSSKIAALLTNICGEEFDEYTKLSAAIGGQTRTKLHFILMDLPTAYGNLENKFLEISYPRAFAIQEHAIYVSKTQEVIDAIFGTSTVKTPQ